jgi:hypothetical protein
VQDLIGFFSFYCYFVKLSVAGGIAPYGRTKKCYLVMEWNRDQKRNSRKMLSIALID